MASFPEVDEQRLIEMRWNEAVPFAVYIYTPLCGTCRIGEKMLGVAAAIVPNAHVVKSNVNFLPHVVSEWKIESVPCMAFVREKRVVEKIYTMRSVEFLLEKLRERLQT